ncbi:MAG: DUF72 domain-containing protein [Deltaproteobacteria bacterium]
MPRPRAPVPPAGQLDLFASPAPAAPAITRVDPSPAEGGVLAETYARAAELAARVPSSVYFGTSSWSFPGWAGIVYAKRRSESLLARDGLAEYARHPLLRTVGVDRGYYAPIPRADFERYASQLPEGFPCCIKLPEIVTTPVHLGHRGVEAGTPNPDFLSVDRFMDDMGRDAEDVFRAHVGTFVIEFPPVPRAHRLAPDVFVRRLDGFLGALPRSMRYAVEIRERSYLTPAYREVLAAHGVAHTYNYWTAMPRPVDQLAAVPIDNAPFAVVRLLLRPGTRYDERKNAFAPFDQVKDVDEVMRRGVVDIVKLAMASGRTVYVLVNNKAEGSAPGTIAAIAAMLAADSG